VEEEEEEEREGGGAADPQRRTLPCPCERSIARRTSGWAHHARERKRGAAPRLHLRRAVNNPNGVFGQQCDLECAEWAAAAAVADWKVRTLPSWNRSTACGAYM
jgi:hypothetical protein